MKNIILILLVSVVSSFGAYNSSGTDYDKAQVREYTEEGTLRALNTVNMILRFMKDSRAEKFVNKGPYKVMQKDDKKKGGKQTGTGNTKTESLVPMTFNVTRDVNNINAPMIVKLWLDEKDGPNDNPMRIIGHMSVEKGVDSEYPMGKFTFHFSGFGIEANGDTNTSATLMNGVLSADKGNTRGLSIIQYENNMSNMQVGNLIESIKMEIDTQNRGKGFTTVFASDGGMGVIQKKYKLTLDTQYYRVQEVNATTHENIGSPVVKDKKSKIIKTFRYGLYYDTNGSKVVMNSGFPIKDASGNYGYAGYWGIWSENDVLGNGDSVTREGTSDTYSVVVAPGKLKKYTKTTARMDSIKNTKLYFWNQTDGQQYILTWDNTAGGGNGNYKILGIQDNYGEATSISDTGKYLFSTDGDDNATSINFSINEWSSAWSEALQARIKVKSTITNSSTVSFHKEEVVVPTSDMNLANFGWEIINPNMDINDLNGTASIRVEQNASIIGNMYQFNASSLTLVDLNRSNSPVVFANNADFNNTTYQWWTYGTQMGPLLTMDRAANYNGSNWWEVEQNENVYYRWETGTRNWNKFTGLKNGSNEILNFDPPMVFAYTHDSTKDTNGATNNGGLYSLKYDGYDLQIPWRYEASSGVWFPKINIKSGTNITDGTTTYRIKALESGILIGETSSGPSSWPLNDLNTSYDGVEHNSSLISVTGHTVPDANVTVIKGKCLFRNCAMTP